MKEKTERMETKHSSDLRSHRVLFLGGGHMAESIIQCLLAAESMEPEQISVLARNREKLLALGRRHGVAVLTASGAVSDMSDQPDAPGPEWDTVILAVPPQAIGDALRSSRNFIPQDALIISVCAGVTIAEIQVLLDEPDTSSVPGASRSRRVVRVMPNTLGAAAHGFSALCPSAEATEADIAYTKALFGCLGQVRSIGEDMFDAFTAFSCSGPAYVLEFIGAMTRAGVQAGFSENDSRSFVLENLLGTARLLQESGEDPAHVLDRMCTPGGITIEAMESLSSDHFADLIDRAVQAGIRRTGELQTEPFEEFR